MQRIIPLAKRARPLLRLASEYTVANVVNRLLAATSALLLVRLLPINEYGFYTLAMSAFTFVCTFSDLGATEALSFFRRRAAKRNKSWMPYFYAVLRFRRTVFLFGLIVSSTYISIAGSHIGQDSGTILSAVALMAFGAWFAIQSSISTFVLKLDQRFRQAYAVDFTNEASKLFAVIVIWIFSITTAIAGLAGVAFGAFAAALLATALARRPTSESERPSHRRMRNSSRLLLGQITPILPGTIYFTLQAPLVAWLAAYYGSVANLAEVGALGRISLLMGLIAGFTANVFIPRLVAITNDALFLRRYFHWWLILLCVGGFLLIAVSLFPDALLLLLGDQYSGLQTELMVAAAAAVFSSWSAFSWHVNRVRGWVKYQLYRVPVFAAGQVAMFLTLDLSTTQGVLVFGMGTILLDLIFQTVISVIGFIAPIEHAHPSVNA